MLQIYRDSFVKNSLEGIFDAAAIGLHAPESLDADAFELLLYAAIQQRTWGWAFICANRAMEATDDEARRSHIEGVVAAVVDQHLRPYRSDREWLDDVATWAVERGEQLYRNERSRGESAPWLEDRALDLRHRWFFRLHLSNAEDLAIHRMSLALELTPDDLSLLALALVFDRRGNVRRMRQRRFNEESVYPAHLLTRFLATEPGEHSRLAGRLAVHSPLLRHRLLYLNSPVNRPHTALLNRLVEVDDVVHATIEGRRHTPEGLDHLLTVHAPTQKPRAYTFFESRMELISRVDESRDSSAYIAIGTSAYENTLALAQADAYSAQKPLVEVRIQPALKQPGTLEHLMRLVVRETRLAGGLLLINTDRETESPEVEASVHAMKRGLALLENLVLFDSPLDADEGLRRVFDPLYEVRVLPPTLDEQVGLWSEALEESSIEPLTEQDIRRHVCDMALGVGDIWRAARLAAHQRRLHHPDDGALAKVDPGALRALASSKLNQGMAGIAERMSTSLGWNDVVLPDAVLEKLMEVITFSRYQRQVFEEWGFGGKVPYGRANSSLFTGPPGTGKTMVAGIIARELGMDLYRVDVSQIVSKYVGETEKNLKRVFEEASRSHAVLLFDEADSLFAKRTSVKSAQDRYSNLEVNYLLQRIETFEGITVLTSNFSDNIDDAFARRIKFKVEFPFPEPEERALLWRVCLPKGANVADEVDFGRLGRAFELSGGSIKNAVVRSAFTAAEAGRAIDTAILEQGGIAECQEMGKLLRIRNGRVVLPEDTHKNEKH